VSPQRVLVAFASRSGSTAGIAEAIAAVLRDAGLAVDSRPAGDVPDVTAYDAVVLGSGVFLPRRGSDGGGFLVRHEAVLKTRAVWLFCAGPIGRGRSADGTGPSGSGDCSVAEVARFVGARGCAEFGTPVPEPGADPVAELAPVDVALVRAWACEIAADLGGETGAAPRDRTAAASRSLRPPCRVRTAATG
jgi:menaquinone-dependent protoporphyrinogen oxidase